MPRRREGGRGAHGHRRGREGSTRSSYATDTRKEEHIIQMASFPGLPLFILWFAFTITIIHGTLKRERPNSNKYVIVYTAAVHNN